MSEPSNTETDFIKLATATLRQPGHRLTVATTNVIRELAKDDKTAKSARQIHENILSDGGKVDGVSVYRILERLIQHGLIIRVGAADGYVRVEKNLAKKATVVEIVSVPGAQEVRHTEIDPVAAIQAALLDATVTRISIEITSVKMG